ncbi:family 1 glycosylhydrolase [Trichocoleus sp. FACHB-262]|uniref:family 1 glycosylhydrolase n=1 Tax=Trichocoleus sp. FACHB-262 TaxID=2692869 RepID=UPI001689D756|nr:family 1 glycosylhydrolase [Trichocoleus sp. FACHB-262]MBD2120587.1 sugar nucleotide-binding protein [Trichocoleus sp. FACHB-262]
MIANTRSEEQSSPVNVASSNSVANSANSAANLELWAGIECTVNRIGDQYFDQLERNGHLNRIEDLDLFDSLGITAIRYPALWERIAPNGLAQADWSWLDQRLARLDDLGIRPILGLVHHGSGPKDTSLLDPAFPEKLAEFAHAVATRYPWITHYTPVNEPLTTARFSALYGHWYPHKRDGLAFIQALLNQCRAVVLSMQAIRQINPSAQLVQTEDLGKIFSTPLLAYQAEFENNRRWLSLDLLCGRVDREHPLWEYLRELVGIGEAELTWFLDHPCPPDIMGINRYLTSDRFLDERLERYPAHTHGGNGKHQYADVEAVRVCVEGICDAQILLKEVWDRYQLPIAVTEVHLGCTREEQLRWLKEIWEAAQQLRTDGVDIRAVTAWSLLGAYDWNSLLTRSDGYYEPGVFDLRSPQPRPTALAQMLRQLAEGNEFHHPLLAVPGWWQRPERLLYPPVNYTGEPGDQQLEGKNQKPVANRQESEAKHWKPRVGSQALGSAETSAASTPPLLITGATGTLGKAFARLCEVRGIPYQLLSRQDMDITNPDSVDRVIAELKPWAVVNTAGYVRVDDAEREPELCRFINTDGAAILAETCANHGAAFVTFSSDLVFDGNRAEPYVESCEVAPLNVYGHSKAIAEQRVLANHPCSLVIRTSAFFGPWDEHNFLAIALRTLASGQPFIAAEDAVVSPTYVPDLVNNTLDLLIDGECGIWHLANSGAIAWSDLAQTVANLAGLDTAVIEARPTKDLGWAALRPTYSALSSERGILLPSLDDAIDRYLCQRA